RYSVRRIPGAVVTVLTIIPNDGTSIRPEARRIYLDETYRTNGKVGIEKTVRASAYDHADGCVALAAASAPAADGVEPRADSRQMEPSLPVGGNKLRSGHSRRQPARRAFNSECEDTKKPVTSAAISLAAVSRAKWPP